MQPSTAENDDLAGVSAPAPGQLHGGHRQLRPEELSHVKDVIAVTLKRPWPYAITHLGKDIENRTWQLHAEPGTTIAIHAGKGWDADGAAWIESAGLGSVPPEPEHPAGAVVALATFTGNVAASESAWFFGPIGWQLVDIQPIKPIYCRGQQGAWNWPGGDVEPIDALSSSPFKPGQVLWLPMTYYGVEGWHLFEVVGDDVATTRTEVNGIEVVDTVIINDWVNEHARTTPPKPAQGSTIEYLGTQMVVYHPGTTEDSIWLMRPGGTVVNVYQWPPMPIESDAIAPATEATPESGFDSANPRGFSDSTADEEAIAPDFDSSFDSSFDSANPRRCGDLWLECGPYKTAGITYYRYRWGRGHKIVGVRHIPGGALTRLVVANRAYRVHQAVHVEGRSHAEVLAMIDGWRKPRARKRAQNSLG